MRFLALLGKTGSFLKRSGERSEGSLLKHRRCEMSIEVNVINEEK
jgi:hypothetical protein